VKVSRWLEFQHKDKMGIVKDFENEKVIREVKPIVGLELGR
jgi:hypothetical protein